MIKIGVTGGIGSGKSVFCELFRLQGIPVYDADARAKDLNNSSQIIRENLIHFFGEDLYKEGQLNKKLFASIIFNDPEKLKLANSIIHPELAKDFIKWSELKRHFPYVVIDAAVLIEARFQNLVNLTVSVTAPQELRIKRAADRDKVPVSLIEERLRNQINEDDRLRLSDYIIYNDNEHSLIKQYSDLIAYISKNL